MDTRIGIGIPPFHLAVMISSCYYAFVGVPTLFPLHASSTAARKIDDSKNVIYIAVMVILHVSPKFESFEFF